MDILTYEYLLQGLKDHNEKSVQNYGNKVLRLPPKDPKYPISILREIRNSSTRFNSCYQRVASVGYRIDIFAKTKGKITHDVIARTVAKEIDDYMTSVNLSRVSKNENELIDEQGAYYHIILTYEGNLDENRMRFI